MEIMIVDDEPQVAEVLATSLKRQGHSTTVVHSGREALDRLKSVAFDAMFLDVSMPGMNGLDVMAEVRRLRPSLAVVVITGHATPEEIEDPETVGAHALPSGDRAPALRGREKALPARRRRMIFVAP